MPTTTSMIPAMMISVAMYDNMNTDDMIPRTDTIGTPLMLLICFIVRDAF